MSSLPALFSRAVERRRSLREAADTTAYRLLNAEGDGLEDVTLDWFDGVAVLSLYRSFVPDEEARLLDAVTTALSPRSLYLKRRPREARVVANTRKAELAPETAARGAEVEAVDVLESGLRFRIRPGQGLSVGLYLDMREGRRWVREHAAGRRVLNLFAYTCGFGVAARAGGAARALNVDLSRRVLDWGAENLSLNGHPPEPHDFLAGDVFEWARRLTKKEEQFELVILDPPSFSTGKGTRFSAARDYPKLVADCAALIAPGGVLLACCNLASLTFPRFRAQVLEGLAGQGRTGRQVLSLDRPPIDFPEAAGAPPALKVMAFEVR